MKMKVFSKHEMDPSETQMESILIDKDMINMEDIMKTMVNMFHEKVGMKKIIIIKKN